MDGGRLMNRLIIYYLNGEQEDYDSENWGWSISKDLRALVLHSKKTKLYRFIPLEAIQYYDLERENHE